MHFRLASSPFSCSLGFAHAVLDPKDDQKVVDEKSLPKGKHLPMVILHEKQKQPLAHVIKIIIEKFVQKDSVILVSNKQDEEVKALENQKVKILHSTSLHGIENQWVILTTASDIPCHPERLSRARNGLVVILDIPFVDQVR